MNAFHRGNQGSAIHISRKSVSLLCSFCAVLVLPGCGTFRGKGEAPVSEPEPASEVAVVGDDAGGGSLSFRVKVNSSNRRIANHLERYLDIQRFKGFPDLQPGELRRLMAEAETNARDLLAAQGFFNPQLELRMEEPASDNAPRRIVIEVDPGKATTVDAVTIRFAEPMSSDPVSEAQRETIRKDWLLEEGETFTQDQWDAAKVAGLRNLQRERYPTARIADSRATIRADEFRAGLDITYDAGALYRFGDLDLRGTQRYDAQGIRNIARIPTGTLYSEEALLESQQRLVDSGYFDSAFLMLDTDNGSPEAATVIAQVREAKLQKLVLGLGYSTDAGPRLSADHTHNSMWPFGWRAFNQFALGTDTQSLSTHQTDMPDASGWAWYTTAGVERSAYGDFNARSGTLTGGRTKSANRIDRTYFLQYDSSTTEGVEGPGGSSSILANYGWTGRYFNNRINPTSGHGLGVEAGIGYTLSPQQDPFLRVSARALKFWPFGSSNTAGHRSRLALRAELGAIYAAADVNIPVRLLFLTGGDTTVRGYGYQTIGTRLPDGSIYGARYMAMGSAEWQRPITLFGDAASYEHTTFVDVGTASDRVSEAIAYTGVGTGLRWRSPVGPLQVDAAYGLKEQQWRLHLRMGFQF